MGSDVPVIPFLITFGVAFGLSLTLTPLAGALGRRLGLLDEPRAEAAVLRAGVAVVADGQGGAVHLHLTDEGVAAYLVEGGIVGVGEGKSHEADQTVVGRDGAQEDFARVIGGVGVCFEREGAVLDLGPAHFTAADAAAG